MNRCSSFPLHYFFHICIPCFTAGAFAEPFGAYSPPYLYLLAIATPLKGVIADGLIVKLVAMLGNVALAAAMWRLLRALHVDDAARIGLCLLALPSLMINAALLGQSDALYAAPVLMAIAAALERRHTSMLAWCGLALAIKMQTVLIGPFVLVLLIVRRVPLRYWLMTPATYSLALLPAWLAGWPASSLLTVYSRQADTFHDVARNAPNVWMVARLFGFNSDAVAGLAMVVAIGAIAAYLARHIATARHFSPVMLLRLALLAPLMGAGLLPRMHERYFLLADILAIALALVSRRRGDWQIAVYVQVGSLLGLFAYMMGLPWLAGLGAVPMLVATWLVVRPLVQPAANDNPLLVRPI
jgi:Gpi18-like mannosyltransferase